MRVRDVLRRAQQAVPVTSLPARAATILVCVLAGLMMAVGAIASRGNDLRPNRTTELAGLVRAESDRADALGKRAAGLRQEVDDLTRQRAGAAGQGPAASALATAAEVAAATPVTGPAVTVTLTDAPASVQPAGVDEDLLVVHQQDIQAVVNELWAAGAEAVTIQGQRVSSRTGIKCVGNTVVVHGVPYAPPYVISAIGDQNRLERGLRDSHYLGVYRQYVDAYRLGYDVARQARAEMPAYAGPATFKDATAVR